MTLLERTYAAFNARDIDGALAAMHPDVDWPNGMEGGRVHGHRAVREYWTRQWGLIDPRVEPRGFATEADGRIAVDVRQVVRDRAGVLLKDQMVQHVYRLEDGLVRAMEIPAAEPRAHPRITSTRPERKSTPNTTRRKRSRSRRAKSSMPPASPTTAGRA